MRQLKYIAIAIVVITFDLAVYIVIGIALMDYDDFYDASKGEYWSLASMTPSQQAVYIGMHVWHGVNVLAIVYFLYRLIKRYKKNRLSPWNHDGKFVVF